ncbi:hypothetical protein DYGSA30_25380 [Dyella sp. GSA-30]|nr:hypothetical protein DYGSA30_25380 [Dyella sp. GSA-30]
MSDGSIIAAIIAVHIPRNDAASAGQPCPLIGIHVIDIVHSPGIGIVPMPDIAVHPAIVTAVLAANSSTHAAQNMLSSRRADIAAQPLPYSSWRRHQTPVSLRPLGARSSH